MPSLRNHFESACRVGAFALIGWLIGTTVLPSARRRVERATSAALADTSGAALVAWTRAPEGVALHGDLSTTPAPWAVDWMAALAHSGHAVSWSGSPPAVAISVEASPGPDGGARIDVSAPEGTRVLLRDDVSDIDTVHVSRFGASVSAPVVVGRITATAGGQRFSATSPDTSATRAVVVIGQAGWEGKFIVAALEASGWPVIARFSVAPNVEVHQGDAQGGAGALSLDTSRVAAIVAVDTSVARYGDAIARFVQSGGGLVLAGASGAAAAVAPLAPGALGARTRPASQLKDTISLGSTGIYPIGATKPNAVVLERRADGIAIAARRVGAGRVIQLGYDDSWRWRMAGAAGSEQAHRAWWSRVVASVAYVPAAAGSQVADHESSPVAHLVDRLGPARQIPAASGGRGPVDRRIFMTLIMILLLAEWASRRLRGLR